MNVEKEGGVLMLITVPNLKHSFICSGSGSGSASGFRIPDFLVFHTPRETEEREKNERVKNFKIVLKCVKWFQRVTIKLNSEACLPR